MSHLMKRIELEVEVLTPLHIGTGHILTEGFDYVCYGGRTWRIDLDGLAEELYAADPEIVTQLLRTPPGQLLKPEDLREDAPYIRYVLPGTPAGEQFREAIKDPRDRPYIPGSSLKGAIRTLIAWHAWKNLGLSLSRVRWGDKPKFAAQDLEAEIFGRDPEKRRKSPHHDLLRALRVSDSQPNDTSALGIYQVRVWTGRGGAAPISVEALKPGGTFPTAVTIDETLFSSWASRSRGFPFDHRDWLASIPELARQRAKERLECEIRFWQEAGFKDLVYPFLKRISDLKKQPGSGFPLQLGFGTGWEGTTIGAPLKKDPQWPEIHRRYRLGQAPRAKVQTPPEEFPRSRRVVVNRQGQPVAPLGWVWVHWKEV